MENEYDPDPSDGIYEVTYVYLIRRKGRLRIETDRHRCGMFPLGTWLQALGASGLEPQVLPPVLSEGQAQAPVIIGKKR